MPKNFCIYNNKAFKSLAGSYGISSNQLDLYASSFADRNGYDWKTVNDMLYEKNTDAYAKFNEYLKDKLCLTTANRYSGERELSVATALWERLNGRRTETLSARQLGLVKVLFPSHEIYKDSQDIERIALAHPEKGSVLQSMSNKQLKENFEKAFKDIEENAVPQNRALALTELYESFRDEVERYAEGRMEGWEKEEFELNFSMNKRASSYYTADFASKNIYKRKNVPVNRDKGVLNIGGRGSIVRVRGTEIKLTASDVTELSQQMVQLMSMFVTNLNTNANANAIYFGDIFAGVDFTKMTRKQIFETVGVNNLVELAKWQLRSSPLMAVDAAVKVELYLNNFDDYEHFCDPYMISMENMTMRGQDVELKVNMNDEDDAKIEDRIANMGDEQVLIERDEMISSFSKLPLKMRQFLWSNYVVDNNGNMLFNKYGQRYTYDPYMAYYKLINLTHGCVSIDEMITNLTAYRNDYPFINTILRMLKEDSQFESQFFRCMNETNLQFAYSYYYTDDNGLTLFKFAPLNANTASRRILARMMAAYYSGEVSDVVTVNPDSNVNDGKGRLNAEGLRSILEEINELRGLIDGVTFNTADELRAVTDRIAAVLERLGMRIDNGDLAEALGDGRLYTGEAIQGDKSMAAYRFLGDIDSLVEAIYNKSQVVGDADFNPFVRSPYEDVTTDIFNYTKEIISRIAPYSKSYMDKMAWHNGESYYTVGTPTSFSMLVRNLSADTPQHAARARRFIQENYINYRYFNPTGNEDDIPAEMFMKSVLYNPISMHRLLDSSGVDYEDMSEADLVEALVGEYSQDFYGINTPGEKGSLWTMKGTRYKIQTIQINGTDYVYCPALVASYKQMVRMDIVNMISVFQKAGDYLKDGKMDKGAMIDALDVNDEKIAGKSAKAREQAEGAKGVKAKDRTLTRDDLVDSNGKIRKAVRESGLTFKLIRDMNDEIIGDTELGRMVIDKINGKTVDDALFDSLLETAVIRIMDKIGSDNLKAFVKYGLFNSQKQYVTDDAAVTKYDYLDAIVEQQCDMRVAIVNGQTVFYRFNANTNKYDVVSVPESEVVSTVDKINRTKEMIMRNMLTAFAINDHFAKTQSYLALQGNPAQMKTTADFFNRMGGVLTPAQRLFTQARDYDGKRYSDGKLRSVYISDIVHPSYISDNLEALCNTAIEMLDKEIPNLTDDKLKEAMDKRTNFENFKKNVIPKYKDSKAVKSTDGQAWTSPTGSRKKLGCAGSWTKEMEQAYKDLMAGKLTVDNIGMIIQPVKPVTYGYEDVAYNSGDNPAISIQKVRVYQKCSEYMLAYAGALAKGDPKANIIKALLDVMEESHYVNGEYVTNGIDHFIAQSGVKVGAHHMVDLNGVTSYDEAKQMLEEAIYSDRGAHIYNEGTVHEIDMEDYGVIQENPLHFRDFSQAMGTQVRVLVVSNIDMDGDFEMRDYDRMTGKWETKTYKGSDVAKEYWDLTAANIKAAFDLLVKEFGIDKNDAIKTNREISRILCGSVIHDMQRYGRDLYEAVRVDEDGMFRVPLNDPMLGTRVMNLVCATIRNTVNKQMMPGGPVVQTSSAMYSKELEVRFRDSQGNLVKSFGEFCAENGVNRNDTAAVEKLAERYKTEVLGRHQDKEGKWVGGTAALAYFECRIPIPTKEMYEALTKEDGTLMTPDEAVKAGIITEEALKCIATRIPTEDKYSILPMKAVGFVSDFGGEVVQMPDDIVLITGSDFDIDKMYIQLKSFWSRTMMTDPNRDKFVEDFVNDYMDKNMPDTGIAMSKKTKEAYDKVVDTYRKEARRNILDLLMGEFKAMTDFDRALQDFYDNNGSKYTNKQFLENNNKSEIDGRTNRIFDLEWSMLTNHTTMDQLFNPGNFDNLRTMSRVIEIMQKADYSEERYGTYEQLMNMSLDELDEMLVDEDNLDPFYTMGNVEYQQRSVIGLKMTGIAANNVTAHAFLSAQDYHLNLSKNLEFTFNGRHVKGDRIDPVFSDGGAYVSRNLATFVDASVDSRKDPVLRRINFNNATCNAYMALLRLGFDIDSAVMFMSLPTITDIASRYTSMRNRNGFTRIDDVIDAYLKENGKEMPQNNTRAFTNDEIAGALAGQNGYEQVQWDAVALFRKLSVIGDQLNRLSLLTKYNTMAKSAGPTIGDIVVNVLEYRKFIDMYTGQNADYHIFDKDVLGIINDNPVLKAFYDTTVSEGENEAMAEKEDTELILTYGYNMDAVPLEKVQALNDRKDSAIPQGIAQAVFAPYFPHYCENFRVALNTLIASVPAKIDAKMINRFANNYQLMMIYNNEDNRIFRCDSETLDYLTGDGEDSFVSRYLREIQSLDNALVNNIDFNVPTGDCPFRTLSVHTKGMDEAHMQNLRDGWLELYNDPATRWFAEDLFNYTLLRNGLNYTQSTFANVVPYALKAALDEYTNGLDRFKNSNVEGLDTETFVLQFLRNNAGNSRLVPKLESDSRNYAIMNDDNGVTYFTFTEDADLSSIITRKVRTGWSYGKEQFATTYARVANIDGHVCYNMSDNLNSPLYIEVGPLGIDGEWVEFNPNENGTMASYFDNERFVNTSNAGDGVYDGEGSIDDGTVSDQYAADQIFYDNCEAEFLDSLDLTKASDEDAIKLFEIFSKGPGGRSPLRTWNKWYNIKDSAERNTLMLDFAKNELKMSDKELQTVKELLDKFC